MNSTATASRTGLLISLIGEVVYDLSGMPIDKYAPSTSFLEMGFDSLFLTQASQSLQKKFGVKVTFRHLLDSAASPLALAEYLDSMLPADRFAPAPPAAPQAIVHDDMPMAPSPEQPAAPAADPSKELFATLHAAPQMRMGSAPATSSGIEGIIAQQLSIMQQQLAVLAAHGFPTPTTFPAAGPMPALASVAPAPPEPAAPDALPVAPAPDVAAPPVKQHGPFKPIERGETGGLTDRQQAHLERLIARWLARTPKSKAYTQAGREHLADPRAVAGFKQIWKEIVYPIVGVRSAGSRIWDIDGNEYIDLTMGFGVNLFGHNPDFVARALEEQMKLGVEIGPQSPLASEVAALICEFTGMDRVTFCNTGSESVMAAVRAARTVTGKSKIVYFTGDYHGTHDEVLLRANNSGGRLRSLPIAPGIPDSAAHETIILEYGSAQALRIIEENADELAAVLVEPVQSRNPSLQPREFLHDLRRITAEHGIALIFDEVITGFRSHPGGAQAFYGVKADLATYGKVIGGGMPFGAVAGRREYMDVFDGGAWNYGDSSFPEVGVTFFAGTFVRHPLAMAASRAVLYRLKEEGPGLQAGLNARTERFVADLNRHFRSVGAPVHIPHFSSVFYIHFDDDVKWGSLLWIHLREKGVHIWEGRPCFLSTSHSDDDIAYLSWAFKASVAEMQIGGFLAGSTLTLEEPPAFAGSVHAQGAEPREAPAPAAGPQADRGELAASRPARRSMFTPKSQALAEAAPPPAAAQPAPVAPPRAAAQPAPSPAEAASAASPDPVVAERPPAASPSQSPAQPDAVLAQPAAPPDAPVDDSSQARAASGPISAPMTHNQKEIWLATRMAENASRAFDESVALHLRGPLVVDALRQAIDSLVQRHQAFRTTFAPDGSTQLVAPQGSLDLRVDDLSALSLDEADAALTRILAEEGSQLFDLENGPLFSMRLVKMDDLYHVLSITGHHIVFDGWSLGVALDELSKLYTGATTGADPALPEPMLYTDYARRQLAWENSQQASLTEAYWLEQESGDIPVLALPTDHVRSAIRAYAGSCETIGVPGGLFTGLRQLGASHGCTLLAAAFAAWTSLLMRLSGQTDIIVGMPAAGQLLLGDSRLIGHCVNLLPLRFRADLNTSFSHHLKATRAALLDAYEHQNCTFGALIQKLRVARDSGQTPLVSATFNIDRHPAGLEFAGLTYEITTNPRQHYQFEIGINIVEFDKELLIEANYDGSLYEAETIQRWLGCFERLLQSAVENPEQALGDLLVAPESERRLVVDRWSGDAPKYPRDASICDLFEEQAARQPERVAATFNELKITYSQLNAYANQLARHLAQLGAGPGEFVGILLDRSLEMLIALLAVLKSGAAYLPLDAAQPGERIASILSDAGAKVLVTQRKYSAKADDPSRRQVLLDTDWNAIAAQAHDNPPSVCNGDSLAYVMFTSGSTGVPKGVLVPHRGVVRLVRSANYAAMGPDETFLHMAPLAFDASTFEIWGPLLNGGRIVVVPPGEKTVQEIAEQIAKHSVTTVWLTAGLFHAFIDSYPQGLKPVRQLLAGGDVLSVTHVEKALKELPGVQLINGYGPTEGTTFSCCHPIAPSDTSLASIPIGRPISNTTVYILDARMQPVPIGVEGELYIGGDGLARGYLNDDVLTAEKFVANVFSDEPGSRLYRSGDRARWLPNGCIEFRGRMDQQVKIRGYRIEPGEIEKVINSHPGVRESVVVARTDAGDKRLAAYVVPRDGTLDAAGLRERIAAALPSYMIPSAIVSLPRIPLNANGKPDRRRLPSPETAAATSPSAPAPMPRDEVEKKLLAIWSNVIGHRVGLYDDFWELGGHSLLAVRLFVEIEKEFGKRLPLQTLFTASTVEKLAQTVRGPVSRAVWDSLVPIQTTGDRPPLYCVHHADGVVVCYRDLARYLGGDQPVWGIQAQGLDGTQPPDTKVEEIAARYVRDVLTTNPDGPYLLCGLSFGGIVAFEMARQIRASGRKVDFIGLIDTYAPSYFRSEDLQEKQLPLYLRVMDQIAAIRRLAPKNRLAFIENKLRSGMSRMQNANGKTVIAEDVREYLPAVLKSIKRASEQATVDYFPKPYDGEVVLFRALERLWSYKDRYMGWGGLAETITVREVVGNHYTVIQEPCVQELAKALRRALDEALGSH